LCSAFLSCFVVSSCVKAAQVRMHSYRHVPQWVRARCLQAALAAIPNHTVPSSRCSLPAQRHAQAQRGPPSHTRGLLTASSPLTPTPMSNGARRGSPPSAPGREPLGFQRPPSPLRPWAWAAAPRPGPRDPDPPQPPQTVGTGSSASPRPTTSSCSLEWPSRKASVSCVHPHTASRRSERQLSARCPRASLGSLRHQETSSSCTAGHSVAGHSRGQRDRFKRRRTASGSCCKRHLVVACVLVACARHENGSPAAPGNSVQCLPQGMGAGLP
jgi:hypothetical protein